ncbi:MAG: RsmD family RNA methyltransferase [Patescibacteria group bacterium]|nr:RsmD family RNA methyltransferase [Patescibacteria group bacterium]
MRIIAGSLGGRQFVSPKGNRTHPMSDKARGAIFNALGDINGLRLLDAFAGSGAIAFEALSRGARAVTAVDIETNAFKAMTESAENLGVTNKIEIVRANVGGWFKSSRQDNRYDIIVCDPPYDALQLPIVEKLSSKLEVGGVMVISLPPGARLIMPERCEPLQTKDHGDITLQFFRRTKI